jgi:hypothetical protein
VKTERWRTKGGAPFSAKGKDKSSITQKVLTVKDNYVVIRMGVAGLTQWGPSWRRERVSGRGGIRKDCGNLWKSFDGLRKMIKEKSKPDTQTRRYGARKFAFGVLLSATLYDGVGSVKRHLDCAGRGARFFLLP